MMDRKEQVIDKKGGCGFETAPTLFIFPESTNQYLSLPAYSEE